MREERKVGCPVCMLSAGIKEQLQAAPAKKIKLADRLKWLARLGFTKIQEHDLTMHLNQRHDYA